MKFFTRWQPRRDEDHLTALLFAFFRHAPPAAGLDAWLSMTLGRHVRASRQLETTDFWPVYAAMGAGERTEPDLVIPAQDPDPLEVVVEVKRGDELHTLEQIAREAIDVAARGSNRLALVMVGASLRSPMRRRRMAIDDHEQDCGAARPHSQH